MARRTLLLVVTSALLLAWVTAQALPRDKVERARFMREQPCPANGATRGACPGWVVDHKEPLMLGGEDKPHNMQWLHVDEHRAKTRAELAQCRAAKEHCKKRSHAKPRATAAKRARSR